VGGPPVAILSHELWQSAFGGAPIVGRTVEVDGRPHDIIGIMPPGFDVMDNRTQIWLPIGIHPVIRGLRENHILQVVGRLRPGITPQAAEAELATLLQNWSERAGVKGVLVDPVTHAEGHVPTSHPSRAQDHSLRLQSLQEAILGDATRVIWVLQTAAGLDNVSANPAISLRFHLYDELGQPVATLDSAANAPRDSADGRPEEIVCEVDELPLLPGRYRVDVSLRADGHLQDELQAAAWFNVEDGLLQGRPVGLGALGRTTMPHAWRLPKPG